MSLESCGAERVAALLRAPRHPARQLGALFQGAQRGPERALERLRLLGEHALPRVRVPDVALVADDFALFRLPDRAAALGAGKSGGRARHVMPREPFLVPLRGLGSFITIGRHGALLDRFTDQARQQRTHFG